MSTEQSVKQIYDLAMKYKDSAAVSIAIIYEMMMTINSYPPAQRYIGLANSRGLGVTKNIDVAIQWYTQAINNGDVEALNSLGVVHFNKNNFNDALALFKQSSACGNMEGTCHVADMYMNGWGVEVDIREALRLYKISADGGCTMAMVKLATEYYKGVNMDKNIHEAIVVLKKASDAKNTDGTKKLQQIFDADKNVIIDYMVTLKKENDIQKAYIEELEIRPDGPKCKEAQLRFEENAKKQ